MSPLGAGARRARLGGHARRGAVGGQPGQVVHPPRPLRAEDVRGPARRARAPVRPGVAPADQPVRRRRRRRAGFRVDGSLRVLTHGDRSGGAMRKIDLHCYPGTQPWIDSYGPFVEALATYWKRDWVAKAEDLSLIHISEPTRLGMISYAVFCLTK